MSFRRLKMRSMDPNQTDLFGDTVEQPVDSIAVQPKGSREASKPRQGSVPMREALRLRKPIRTARTFTINKIHGATS